MERRCTYEVPSGFASLRSSLLASDTLQVGGYAPVRPATFASSKALKNSFRDTFKRNENAGGSKTHL